MTSSWNHHQSVEDAVWLSLPEMEADFWGEVQRSLSWQSLRLLLISFSDFKTKTVSTTIQQDAKTCKLMFFCSRSRHIIAAGGTDAVFFAEVRQSESVATFPSINSAFSPLYEILKTRPATTWLLFGLVTLLCATRLFWLVVDRLLPPLADQRQNECCSSIQPLELSYGCRGAIFPPRKVKSPNNMNAAAYQRQTRRTFNRMLAVWLGLGKHRCWLLVSPWTWTVSWMKVVAGSLRLYTASLSFLLCCFYITTTTWGRRQANNVIIGLNKLRSLSTCTVDFLSHQLHFAAT